MTCIRDLYQVYPNLNISDDFGSTPLISASIHMHPEAVAFFLEHGARPRQANKKGETALHFLYYGTAEDAANIIEQLVEAGADVNAVDREGNTPLHTIMDKRFGVTLPAMMLLQLGADPTQINNQGQLPLHILSQHIGLTDPSKILDLFLALLPHSDVNLQDKSGNTPLHYLVRAARNRWTRLSHSDLIRLLVFEYLIAGARTDISNNDGETVDDLWASYFASSSSSSFGKARANAKKSMRNSRKSTNLKKSGKARKARK